MYYECHVTVTKPTDASTRLKYRYWAKRYGWTTSEIDGDPLLGQKVFFYFTCHSPEYGEIFQKMKTLAVIIGSAVQREKIEQIIYDSRIDGKTLRNEKPVDEKGPEHKTKVPLGTPAPT